MASKKQLIKSAETRILAIQKDIDIREKDFEIRKKYHESLIEALKSKIEIEEKYIQQISERTLPIYEENENRRKRK